VPAPIIGYPQGQPPGYQPPPAYPPPPPGYLPVAPVPPLVAPRRPTAKRQVITAVVGVVVAVFVLCCCGYGLLTTITGWPGGTSKTTTIDPTASALLGKAAILSWLNDGGSGLVDKLGADFEELHAASGVRGQQNANLDVHVACGHIQTDTEAARAYKPIPDQQAQALWAKALAAYARGATDCLSATDRVDASLLGQATDEIGQGNTALGQVTARVQQVLTG